MGKEDEEENENHYLNHKQNGCANRFSRFKKYDEIAIDLETKDPNLNERMGSGSVVKVGDVVGISVSYTLIGAHTIQ